MTLRALCIIGLVTCFSPLFAGNQHAHVNAVSMDASVNEKDSKSMSYANACEIEIINQSYDDVRVYGVFDDGVSLVPFNVYRYEYPHYISLYYYGYCHDGMDLYIDTFYGDHVYAGYVSRGTTIRIVPTWFGGKKQVKAMMGHQ